MIGIYQISCRIAWKNTDILWNDCPKTLTPVFDNKESNLQTLFIRSLRASSISKKKEKKKKHIS